MRTPEVEKAISNTKAGMYCTDDADTLAAEVERLEAECCTVELLKNLHKAAEARVKELEVVRDALIRSEESAHQMEELLTNQAQEYIERAEAAEQRAEESERAFGLLEEAHKATTAKFAEMMQRVKELEALEPKRAQFDSDHCMHVLVPHDKYEQMERAETRLRELQAGDYEKLEAQNARLRAAHFEARDATATARGFMREAESMIASMVRTDDPMGYLVTGTAVRDNLRTGIKIIEDKWKLSEDLKAALSGEEASK